MFHASQGRPHANVTLLLFGTCYLQQICTSWNSRCYRRLIMEKCTMIYSLQNTRNTNENCRYPRNEKQVEIIEGQQSREKVESDEADWHRRGVRKRERDRECVNVHIETKMKLKTYREREIWDHVIHIQSRPSLLGTSGSARCYRFIAGAASDSNRPPFSTSTFRNSTCRSRVFRSASPPLAW